MKTNLVHKLHRIQHFGILPLAEFKAILSKEDFRSCEKAKKGAKTWYSLTINAFTCFLYRVRHSSLLFV